ncbi:peptide ABC transporter substrate-binding protein, partial [Halobacteriales archaeon QS_7_68_65]
MNDDNRQTRRRFLKATGGAAAGVALAGCSGGGDGSGGNDSGGDGGGDGTTAGDAGGDDTATPGDDTATSGEGNASGDGNESGSQETQQMEANPDATLQLINSTMTTLDPIASTDTASGRVVQQLYDALMNYPNGQASVEAQLAEGYELSDDQTTYTFNIKQDAQFHNGDQVTAQDFVYSFER